MSVLLDSAGIRVDGAGRRSSASDHLPLPRPHRRAVRWLRPSQHAAGLVIPSVVGCTMTMAAIKFRLAIGGLGPTLRWVRRRMSAESLPAPIAIEVVESIEFAVAMAAALYPGKAMCLERSLVLFYLARRAGIPVTYHHGVQSSPFKAHAWVELDGRILNDTSEYVGMFARLPQVCP